MKCHTTKKQTWIFGILFVFTAAIFGTVSVKFVNAAETKKQEVDVKFTFNSALSLTIDKQGITISDLLPGNSKESEPAKLTVETNSANGFYLSATAGTKGGTSDLTGNNGGKFTMMATNANKATIGAADDSTWGFAYVQGTNGDLSKSAFNGLPVDVDNNGSSGTKLIDAASNTAEKVVKFKVGAKAGPTTPAGTYSNQLNFYAVAKD